MGKRFKKIMAVVGSTFMVGATMGMAFAAGGGFPTPFIQDNNADYAIVYGTGSAASDLTGANSINTYLNTFYSADTASDTESITTSDFSSSVSVDYDDNVLGGNVILTTLYDNKISTLLDSEISWNDGDGYDNYNIHEEIILEDDEENGLNVKTTLDYNDELNTSVVLENDRVLEYKYVFDKPFDTSNLKNDDTSDLVISVLGKEYTLTKVTEDSITVSEAQEEIVIVGESVTVDGITLKIDDIFSNLIEINGVLIKEGAKKVVNGIEVEVVSIGYHTISTLPSKAVIKFGKDIERTIDDGDEYIEDDETWKWVINTEKPEDTLYLNSIGVKYDRKSVGFDEDDIEDNAIAIGQSYVLPENYGAVSFDGLTDVYYEDFELSFDDEKLYIKDTQQNEEEKVNVAILEGENDDSIKIGGYETDTIYFEYVPASVGNGDVPASSVNIYFKDIDGALGSDGRIQLIDFETATLVVDDGKVTISIGDDSKTLVLTPDMDDTEPIEIVLGLNDEEEYFAHLGITAETADVDDITIDDGSTNGISIGTREDDVMDYYGAIIRNPESNAENDVVVLSIPSEQVYAEVSIKGQGEVITTVDNENNETVEETIDVPQLGGIVIKDNEASSFSDKNLIIVGGSCINAEAAKLLGGKACGEDFTLKTGVTKGQALIQKFTSLSNADKVAIVIAGYDAIDTTRAVNHFITNSDLDISLGKKTVI